MLRFLLPAPCRPLFQSRSLASFARKPTPESPLTGLAVDRLLQHPDMPRDAHLLPPSARLLLPTQSEEETLDPQVDWEAGTWTPAERRTGVLAIKRGMMSLWDAWGQQMPVTVLQLEDAFVLDHRTMDTHGYQALLVGCRKVPLLTEQDHRRFQMHHTVCTRAGLSFCLKHLAEFPVSGNGFIPVGARMNAAHFLPGQLVDVCAQSKDKGFQGVVKRWGFKGQSASHGTSLAHRSAGSIGCRKDPGKVWKGKKMAGQMGGDSVTVPRLRVVKIDTALNLVYVKGAVPGPNNQPVKIRDTIYGKIQFNPYENAPYFPTVTPKQLAGLEAEMSWSGAKEDPLVKKYHL